MELLALCIGAYLLGSIPFGLVFSRLKGIDPRLYGSKNIGATNVLRTAGPLPAILTLILDISKGGLSVLIAQRLGVSPEWLVGLSAILGHNFPVYLRFKGGKGVATSIGTILALSVPSGLTVIGIWLLVAFLTRYSSLASLISIGSSPAVFTIFKKGDMVWFAIALSLLVIVRHKDNIRRLINGTEKRIGERVITG